MVGLFGEITKVELLDSGEFQITETYQTGNVFNAERCACGQRVPDHQTICVDCRAKLTQTIVEIVNKTGIYVEGVTR